MSGVPLVDSVQEAPGRHPIEPLTTALLAESFGVRDGELVVGGLTVRGLAAAHGTPLYVYDADQLVSRYQALQAVLADFAEVYFSLKANPQPRLAAHLVALGAGLEVASGAEFLLARQAGCDAGKVVFAGPGKSAHELRLAIEGGLGEVHLESAQEIDTVVAIARELGQRVTVAVRVNPSAAAQGGAMRMGGKPSAFGFDEEDLEEVLDLVEACPELKLQGLHLYAGTQVLDARVMLHQWAHGLALGARAARRLGRPLASLDLGGGLGIPYHAGQTSLDLGALAAGVQRLRDERNAVPGLAGTRVLVEPGRWLVGPTGLYLCAVRATKVSRGQRFAILDGGMHHHLAASGNLGQVVKLDHPLLAATRIGEPVLPNPTVLAGPLCTPLDALGRQTPLPMLGAGDLVAVLQSGAYGLSASPVGFLGHPMPAEVMVTGGRVEVLRPRGSFQAPLRNVGAP